MPVRATRGTGSRKISRAITPVLAATTIRLPKTVADTVQPPRTSRKQRPALVKRGAAALLTTDMAQRHNPFPVPTLAGISSVKAVNCFLTSSTRYDSAAPTFGTVPITGAAVGAAAHTPIWISPAGCPLPHRLWPAAWTTTAIHSQASRPPNVMQTTDIPSPLTPRPGKISMFLIASRRQSHRCRKPVRPRLQGPASVAIRHPRWRRRQQVGV